MASWVGQSAFGSVIQEVFDSVSKIINMGQKYPSTLQTIISTLEDLRPLVHEIIQYTQELDRPRAEVETLAREMRAGEELVCRYSNKFLWNFLCFPYYQKKLQARDESLRRTLSVDVSSSDGRGFDGDLKEDDRCSYDPLRAIWAHKLWF